MENVNNNETKEAMTNEEVIELVTGYVDTGMTFYKKTKIALVRRGFIMGLITALALQSLATIVVMIVMMT